MPSPPNRLPLLLCAIALIAAACGDSTGVAASHDGGVDAPQTEDGASTAAASASATPPVSNERTDVILAADWADDVTITFESESVIFTSNGLPNHETAEQYLGTERAVAYDAQFRFPLVPTASSNPAATQIGPIGVAVSGALFFNPFEAEGDSTPANASDETIDGVSRIDSCGGQPLADGSSYHYHGIPTCISEALDIPGEHSAIIGFLFDGFPIYGPQDLGGVPPIDLDACNGHFGPTPDFAEDTYHYHVTTDGNHISECFAGFAIATPVVGG